MKCRKEYQKLYRIKNKEHIKELNDKWYKENREHKLNNSKTWKKVNKEIVAKSKKEWQIQNKDKCKIATDKWKLNNSKHLNNQSNKRYKEDIDFKFRSILRSRLNSALKNNQKQGSAVRDLGCSIPELKQHLETLFQPNMNWNNYGLHGWHIDHIKPLASFDLSIREELLKAVHFSNLQPLWAEDNLKKSNKVYV